MFPIRLWGGLLFLTNLSLVLTGFSSWLLRNDNLDANVNVSVGNVIDGTTIAFLDKTKGDDNTGITSFKYCKDGFVNNDEIDINKGYYYAYLKLNIENIKKAYGDVNNDTAYTSLHLNTSLKYECNNQFTFITESFISTIGSNSGISYFYTVDTGTNAKYLSGTNSISNGTLESSINGFDSRFFNSSNKYINVTIKYCFQIDYTTVDFETSIFPNLEGGNFVFSFALGGY